ncbi:unnamed protein product [Macrosiphum euphorbiae]|uniref:Uncharacterized protein n=1 Tax=Macrosiphum euphorbiae TaxID=13131 RepID=A0AAV0XQN5_9HEMI|nr:unnamed protein product [Macrosiphum euphorbiae]
MTNVKLDLLTDVDQLLMFESGIRESKYVKQNLFRTKKHDIFTVEQNKKALSVYDDKRFILENGIDTLAWGHYKTKIDRNDFVNHFNTLIRNQNQKD